MFATNACLYRVYVPGGKKQQEARTQGLCLFSCDIYRFDCVTVFHVGHRVSLVKTHINIHLI